jgi:hypothetical protein
MLPDGEMRCLRSAIAVAWVWALLIGVHSIPCEAASEAAAAMATDFDFPDLHPPPPEQAEREDIEAPFERPQEQVTETNSYLLEGRFLERLGDAYEAFKHRCDFPITVSAWHWWHVNTGGPLGGGYGIPSTSNPAYPRLNGTYYYGIEASPETACQIGPFTKIGAYSDVRLRDGGTPLRPYYPETAWMQQAYAWAYADPVVLKLGALPRKFGLDWDGSWWGNTAYFDGFMLAYDWGVSCEVTPAMEDDFKVDRYFQFLVCDHLDGSLVGADPKSVLGSSERNTLVARFVPTLQLAENQTLALGVSGMVGEIENRDSLSLAGLPYSFASPGDQTFGAWAIDATYTNAGLKLFFECLQAYGTLSPSQYVSFGPSNRKTDLLLGFNWAQGPLVYRFSYSLGLDDNPSGTQHVFVPGVTLALTKNVECHLEYVRQEVRHSGQSQFTDLENGVQMLVHWHF